MRSLLLVAGIVVVAGVMSTAAQAQNYPWCAYYGGRDGGGANCGFTTYEQCMATLSGMGGYCNRNTQYVPSGAAHEAPMHKPRRHRHPS